MRSRLGLGPLAASAPRPLPLCSRRCTCCTLPSAGCTVRDASFGRVACVCACVCVCVRVFERAGRACAGWCLPSPGHGPYAACIPNGWRRLAAHTPAAGSASRPRYARPQSSCGSARCASSQAPRLPVPYRALWPLGNSLPTNEALYLGFLPGSSVASLVSPAALAASPSMSHAELVLGRFVLVDVELDLLDGVRSRKGTVSHCMTSTDMSPSTGISGHMS